MSIVRNGWLILLVASAAILASACGDDSDGTSDDMDDASMEMPAGGNGGSAGDPPETMPDSGPMSPTPTGTTTPPPPPPEPVVCGDTTCTLPMGAAMLGVTSCCTGDNECGTMSMLTSVCLPPNAPGGIDLSCPDFDVAGFTTWPGCCTPDGECGALDSTASGCIANELLMAPEQSCDYDPNNMCERIVDIACDGAEDCPSGQMCCGQWSGGYRKFVCAEDCLAEETEQGGTWSQICHPGDTCTVEGYECQPNTDFLPPWLYRCRDTTMGEGVAGSTAADEINCGDSVCGAGQKCCLSVPGDIGTCVAEDEVCRCAGSEVPDGGTEDGGSDDAG